METVLQNICDGLLGRGHEVGAIVAGNHFSERDEVLTAPSSCPSNIADVDRGRLIRAASLGVLNSQPLTPGLPRLLRREIQCFQPDLVQIHLPNPVACLSWLAVEPWQQMPPLAIWYHADIIRQRLGRILLAPLLRACLNRARGICVSSDTLARHSSELMLRLDKVEAIPFGIDVTLWQSIQSSYDGPFLFVGRLVGYKGLDLLVATVAELPDARLVIVGEGPLRRSLARRIRQLGASERIKLAGEISHQELVTLMGMARALVLPSLDASETFGLVQLEAMAAGLPVIASRLPTGVAEVCRDHETGLLVEPGSQNDLRQALEHILVDSQQTRAWGAAGRRRVEKEFSADGMISKLEAWYETLLT